MTRLQRRIAIISLSASAVLFGGFLLLYALAEQAAYFYTPSDYQQHPPPVGRPFRLGGQVKPQSLRWLTPTSVTFIVTDGVAEKTVQYTGLLPDLFKEGSGVIAEVTRHADDSVIATRVLAKHDENYLPPEVARALKKTGHYETMYGQP